MLAQGFDLKKNAYYNRLQPYIAYWGAFWSFLFILINGFEVFFKWNVSDFLSACEYQETTFVFTEKLP
jgi:amino acid transporter